MSFLLQVHTRKHFNTFTELKWHINVPRQTHLLTLLHLNMLTLCQYDSFVGVVGGAFTSFSGSGLDICSFSILTLLFRVSEKIATPTSVVRHTFYYHFNRIVCMKS